MSWDNLFRDLVDTRENWPQLLSSSSKNKIREKFLNLTGSPALKVEVCASCAEACPSSVLKSVKACTIDLDLLHRPDAFDTSAPLLEPWLSMSVTPPVFPFCDGLLANVLVDPKGVAGSGAETVLTLCKECLSALRHGRIPALALCNHMYLGDIPSELKELTVVEESMIALCRAKCCILRLKVDGDDFAKPTAQRALKGNLIVYPQKPSDIAKKLPPSIEDITSPICVLFVGAHPSSNEWLRDKAKPLAVRANKVRHALLWLKSHNHLYKDIEINEGVLEELQFNPVLPFHVEHVTGSHATDVSTSGYDPTSQNDVEPVSTSLPSNPVSVPPGVTTAQDSEIPFPSIVITDVENIVSSSQMAAAAIRHLRKKGGSFLQIPHDLQPVNEFFNPELFPMMYPTLYPYGIGGFKDSNRRVPVSMQRQVKHLFSLNDQRFQEHHSFLFAAFNILQRREMLLRVRLKAKKRDFPSLASRFVQVSAKAIHAVANRVSNGDNHTANSVEEKQVLELMKQVNAVSSFVPGSSASKAVQRSELKALMIDQGLPSFYLTINPSDVHNPIVRFLAGRDINVDTAVPTDYDSFAQSMMVSKNPFATAKFFKLYMEAFIHALLGYEADIQKRDAGILGKVKAYYGCVEAQGRGTLHCHMLVWVEGGLSPDEIKQRVMNNDEEFKSRIIQFLDDTISNHMPADVNIPNQEVYHPSTVRKPPVPPDANNTDLYIQKDRHFLIQRCQYHRHSATCYKYDIHSCRFDMHKGNYKPISCFDTSSGELILRCLHGLVNNFNETMLDCI